MSLWQTIKSVLSAFFGVSSGERRQRDFAEGNPMVFLVVGLGVAILLNIFLYYTVDWIIR